MSQLPVTWRAAGLRNLITSWRLRDFVASPRARTTFGIFAALWLTFAINRLLTQLALGNLAASRGWDWTREIVLVTGGSNGLGELVVRKLARKSVKVVAVDLHPPKTPFPANVHFHQLDVTSTSEIKQVAQCIRQNVGEPTVLINNAGIAAFKPLLEETDEEIRRTFDVNIVAHFFLIREFLPHMIRQNHGHIVTIASIASFVTVASNIDYSCTKAAGLALHEGITQELRHRYNAGNVRTSIIHPFWIRTAMTGPLVQKGRIGDPLLEPAEVSDAIVSVVIQGKSRQLFLPERIGVIAGIRGLPTWLQEHIRGLRAQML